MHPPKPFHLLWENPDTWRREVTRIIRVVPPDAVDAGDLLGEECESCIHGKKWAYVLLFGSIPELVECRLGQPTLRGLDPAFGFLACFLQGQTNCVLIVIARLCLKQCG